MCSSNSKIIRLAAGLALWAPAAVFAQSSSADLLKCQKALESRSQLIAKQVGKKVHGCADKVAYCKLAQEIDLVDPTACLASAGESCSAAAPYLTKRQDSAKVKMLMACGLIPLGDLEQFIQGLGFLDAPSECAALPTPPGPVTVTDASTLIDCLIETTRCSAEKEVLVRDPRAQDSLTAVGVASSFPCVAP
jgi:hypothetical protein